VRTGILLVLAAALAGVGCAPAGSGGASDARAPSPLRAGAGSAAATDPDQELLVPPGYGTLRQEDLTVELREGPVRIRVTPLEEWMLRLTAPDTWQRLSSLARESRPLVVDQARIQDPTLFLVSAHSDEPGSLLFPEDLLLENRGRVYRPLSIRGLTAGWGTRRLEPRRTQMAVYAFGPEVELDLGLVVVYRSDRRADWARILRRLDAELARARARARGGDRPLPPQSSPRSYFRSFR
jgi:hypothetical protein